MPNTIAQSIVKQLQSERVRLQNELQAIAAALTAFGEVYRKGKPAAGSRRRLSVAARRRIAAAQRARWAKVRAQKKSKKP